VRGEQFSSIPEPCAVAQKYAFLYSSMALKVSSPGMAASAAKLDSAVEVSLVLIGLGPSSRSASRALRFWVSANNVSLLHLLQTDWRTHSLIFLVTAIALPVSRLSELLKRSAGQSHISISSWTYLDAALQQCYLRRLLARRL